MAMTLALSAPEPLLTHLQQTGTDIQWKLAARTEELTAITDADAWLNLNDDAVNVSYAFTRKPVFIHSVDIPLNQTSHGPHVVRLNGWNGFVQRELWEIAGTPAEAHHQVMDRLGKTSALLPDEPGFVSARIISMIVNEAFLALEQGVSTPNDIDIAMKLGTNYPQGPFEWKSLIGASRIVSLLQALSRINPLYQPAHTLLREAQA